MKLRSALLATLAMTAASAQAMLPTPENPQPTETVEQQVAAPKIDTKLNAFVVRKDETGAEKLELLTFGDSVAKGEIVEYHGLFTNQDTNRVRSMNATLNIPEGVELVGEVSPAIVKASIDGNRFVHMPIRATLNGQTQELPLSYYKALRWTIEDLGIGATAVVKYRAQVK
ncbi:hypothetical protein [Moraxella sp.]|uniref:hypothetical protein n=1 Tax=Moraxella sp. TaxID=479 RepID=UPI0026204A38|nr:hypothetical protein [Moraxella sp.]